MYFFHETVNEFREHMSWNTSPIISFLECAILSMTQVQRHEIRIFHDDKQMDLTTVLENHYSFFATKMYLKVETSPLNKIQP